MMTTDKLRETVCGGVIRRGFSLLEILVVLAVILILVVLAMEGIQRSRDAMNRMICVSNYREVGRGMTQYGLENNGALYPQNTYAASNRRNRWHPMIDVLLGGERRDSQGNLLSPSLFVVLPIWVCPDNSPVQYEEVQQGNYTANSSRLYYWANGSSNTFSAWVSKDPDEPLPAGEPERDFWTMSDIRLPSRFVWLTEGSRAMAGSGGQVSGRLTSNYHFHPGDVSPILFLSNHVEMVPQTHDLFSRVGSRAGPYWNPNMQ